MAVIVVVILAANAVAMVPRPSAATEGTPEPPAELLPFYEQVPAWTSCGTRQECARIQVPLDYGAPESTRIELSVRRTTPLTPDQPALFVNPGGPGVSGTDYVNYVAGLLGSDVRRTYSIVGFDPRGVGNSTPVVCLTGKETTRWLRTDPTPDTRAEVRTLMRRAAAISTGCLRMSPEIAPHVGTDNTVRDLDIMRAVLRQQQLHWLGFSYGTYIGTRYLELFPQFVGRMVLDGPVDPSLDAMQLSRDQSGGFQTAITRYARYCASRSTCPYGKSTASVLAGMNSLLSALDKKPLPTRSSRSLVEAEALTAMFTAMYTPDFWPTLTRALAQAARGDGTGLQNLAALASDQTGPDTYANNSASAFLAIVCWDSPATPGAVALARAARTWSSGTSVPAMARSMAWGTAPCSSWFGHSPVLPAAASTTSTAPVLVIGTRFDPATPYIWAQALHDQLPTTTLLTFNGDGHTGFGAGSPCIDSAVQNYLLSGTMPAASTVCS